MLAWLKSLVSAPQPSGPQERISAFRPEDPTITKDCIRVANNEWLIEVPETRTIQLFEVPNMQLEQCLLTYRAMMKSEAVSDGAFLEMWCRLPGRGEFYSRGLNHIVTGTTDWASYETPFLLKHGQKADLVKLNIVIKGKGKIWIKDIELLRTPLS